MNWHVYIIRASDDSLYTGITTDVERRFQEHQQASSGIKGGRGTKFFYGRQPVDIVYQETGHDRRSASRREAAIKKMSRQQKQRLVLGQNVPGNDVR